MRNNEKTDTNQPHYFFEHQRTLVAQHETIRMTGHGTIDFDLNMLLGEESDKPLIMDSPFSVASCGSFSWNDFPVAVTGQQQQPQKTEMPSDDVPSIIKSTQVSQATSTMTIALPPVVSFDSFSWSQFPIAVTTIFGTECSTHETVGAKASDKTVSTVETDLDDDSLTGYGFGELTTF
uniref:Uncharacterized protein n=1 Tax=Amphora coffeiformis TaxID=265554 RepID=A0A7S3LBD0_9STRA|mmetsp:Transcript_4586/g.9250  ORF Transcript_4586/g.9250 Transcript_4586/m.9250 type:complete len:178 (+) Transcript_4586:75-608(+)